MQIIQTQVEYNKGWRFQLCNLCCQKATVFQSAYDEIFQGFLIRYQVLPSFLLFAFIWVQDSQRPQGADVAFAILFWTIWLFWKYSQENTSHNTRCEYSKAASCVYILISPARKALGTHNTGLSALIIHYIYRVPFISVLCKSFV